MGLRGPCEDETALAEPRLALRVLPVRDPLVLEDAFRNQLLDMGVEPRLRGSGYGRETLFERAYLADERVGLAEQLPRFDELSFLSLDRGKHVKLRLVTVVVAPQDLERIRVRCDHRVAPGLPLRLLRLVVGLRDGERGTQRLEDH